MSEVDSIVNKSTLRKFKKTYHQFLDVATAIQDALSTSYIKNWYRSVYGTIIRQIIQHFTCQLPLLSVANMTRGRMSFVTVKDK